MEKQIRHFLHFPLKKSAICESQIFLESDRLFSPYPLLSSLYYLGFSSFQLYLDTTEIYDEPGKIL